VPTVSEVEPMSTRLKYLQECLDQRTHLRISGSRAPQVRHGLEHGKFAAR